MGIENLVQIRKEAAECAGKLSKIIGQMAKLTEAHINSLPQTGLMGDADESDKKKSVARHYKLALALGERLAEMEEQRSALLILSERVDELASQVTFEELEGVVAVGKDLLSLLQRIDETEKVSGRFLGGLDRMTDVMGKGENADFRSAARICREYFEFSCNTLSYIDNLKFF